RLSETPSPAALHTPTATLRTSIGVARCNEARARRRPRNDLIHHHSLTLSRLPESFARVALVRMLAGDPRIFLSMKAHSFAASSHTAMTFSTRWHSASLKCATEK